MGCFGEWQGAPHQANSGHNGYHDDGDFLGYSFEWDHWQNTGQEKREYNHWVELKDWDHSGYAGLNFDFHNNPGYYFNADDGGWRHCRLVSNGSGNFTFYYSTDSNADFEGNMSFSPATAAPNPAYDPIPSNFDAYVGFTAGTGGASAYHEIRNIEIRTGDDALPVTLSSFTAAYINNQSTLNWTTQSESQNSGWNILRSNSTDFDSSVQVNAGIIDGNGTTSEPSNYIFVDEADLNNGHTYWYWLESISYSGMSEYFGPIAVEINIQDDMQESPSVEAVQGLLPNYPNPFNPVTMFMFNLAENEVAERLEIYNMKGQKVDTIQHPVNPQSWEGRDNSGKELASGIYTYILFTNRGEYSRKMVLTK